MFYIPLRVRSVLLASVSLLATSGLQAQDAAAPATHVLPSIDVLADAPGPLTVLTAQQALREIQRTPGGCCAGDGRCLANCTVSSTVKDMLDYVPGVFAQPKWGDDTRLSIRGSSLSRNFHLRGVQLYMDGIPINTADGYGDFQEIDPTAYQYVEVFKGGNALRFGANSLGGAINFVTATGRDPCRRTASALILAHSASAGCKPAQAVQNGPWDGFITASTQAADGYRDHSYGEATRRERQCRLPASRRISRRGSISTPITCGSAFPDR